MFDPSGEVEKETGSRYSLVIAVAKRARQLREGAPAAVESKSRNPLTIALEEIAAGKVRIVIPTAEEVEAVERREVIAPRGARTTAELLRVPEPEEEAAEVSATEAEEPVEASLAEQEVTSEAGTTEVEGAEKVSLEEEEETVPAAEAEEELVALAEGGESEIGEESPLDENSTEPEEETD